MKYLVGFETCGACGFKMTTISRLDLLGDTDKAGKGECSECGAREARVDVWHPCIWPEVEALVSFDDLRRQLRLRPLTDDRFH